MATILGLGERQKTFVEQQKKVSLTPFFLCLFRSVLFEFLSFFIIDFCLTLPMTDPFGDGLCIPSPFDGVTYLFMSLHLY